MNYIEYTTKLIQDGIGRYPNILVISPGYGISDQQYNNSHVVITPSDGSIDLISWIEQYLNKNIKSSNCLFDLVIMSRILEHLPIRLLDYYLLNLYNLMKKDSTLICVVPDMDHVSEALKHEFQQDHPSEFKINRMHYELFSEGDNTFDRHSIWTSRDSIPWYFQRENLFKFKSINIIKIGDSSIPQLEYTIIRQ